MEDENDVQAKQQQASESEAEGHDEQEAAAAHEEEQVTPAAPKADAGAEAEPQTETKQQTDAADWQAKLAAKDAEMADMKIGYELRLAGARNVTAAKALLAEHKGDIAALKAAEPWMFAADAAGVDGDGAPKGATGLSSAGAAVDEGATLKRWRKLAGLENEK